MKNTIFILLLVSLISCKNEPNKNIEFKWLFGSWERINESVENRTFENWYESMDGNYIGHGYTLKGNDTVFQEKLSIVPKNKFFNSNDDQWILKVTGVNEAPTIFTIIEKDSSSFTAVNLENEFPTHIEYSIDQDTLKAVIHNDSLSINFNFLKK